MFVKVDSKNLVLNNLYDRRRESRKIYELSYFIGSIDFFIFDDLKNKCLTISTFANCAFNIIYVYLRRGRIYVKL